MFTKFDIAARVKYLSLDELFRVLDTRVRMKLFKLATHYWEARWLMEMKFHRYDEIKTPTGLLKRQQRWAKIVPCMVSTLNTLPSFFTANSKENECWINTPVINGIDLLIVDEAGQALPHMAAASFLLAKKALLVGDIYQIEPVWSLTVGIDRSNLRRASLLKGNSDYEDIWLKSHLLASSGNVMKLAHRHQKHIQFPDLEPGLYLTEHRRCYDSIISYCNQLIYQGHLEPLKGNPKKCFSWPTMGFVHHQSTSSQMGSSRINHQEAKRMVQWIKQYCDEISQLGELQKVIAIITPFSMQARVIREELSKQSLSDIQAGTVHTFQGAEAEIILFSSVYANNDKGGAKFYDRGRNLLNVAVSRAKQSFIVFGDEKIFGSAGVTSPSGLLKLNLKQVETEIFEH